MDKESCTFKQEIIDYVWQKAEPQPNNNPDVFRKDYAGAWICREKYGDRKSEFGWEIDHLKPISKGGTDELFNLLPLQWENKVQKGDEYPVWNTSKSSEGNNNVNMKRSWCVKNE